MPHWPRAGGVPPASALIRCSPEDFRVSEELGFDLSGEGEHVFLYLQKRNLNSMELVQRVSRFSAIPESDIGISGLKDRNAITSQWLSVRMAGRPEPDWNGLAAGGDVSVLAVKRHLRKLKRGVHRANRFTLVLREMQGDRADLERRLQQMAHAGAPNYFGKQRFGRGGSTLGQAQSWVASGGRRISRARRSLYLSALRSDLFNALLAERVQAASWNCILPGDICMLQGSRSLFHCEEVDDEIRARAKRGDLHPGLPLWGRGYEATGCASPALTRASGICDFLERAGMDLAWRPARLQPDDFCWQFCDDGSLQLDFALGAGGYATALLAELVQYKEDNSGNGYRGE